MSGDATQVWVDGELVDGGEPHVSAFDHGLLVGDGVFETLRVYDGHPFAWRRHLDRLAESASGLGLPVPDADLLREAGRSVLDANGLREARLRITVTGGVQPLGSERRQTVPTVVVAASEVHAVPNTIAVVVAPWTRNERGATAGLKTISYAENVRALAYAQAQGAGEAVLANTRDELCEATGSNVFVVHDGVLCTPPVSSGCLRGVTRALVTELCRDLSIECREVALPIGALRRTPEAFLTSTVREVQAITSVDGRVLRVEAGSVTSRLAKEYTALVTRDLDP